MNLQSILSRRSSPAFVVLSVLSFSFVPAACGPSQGVPDGATERAATRSAPPSILLISLDTTRADHLGCYGDKDASTPHLDRWASGGVLFENALTPTPMTLPAHTSLMTGLHPHRHGVRDNGIYRVPSDVPTLASILGAAGYDTAAVVAAAVLDRQYGLARGFKRYEDVTGSAGLAILERNAGAVTDRTLEVAATLEAPYFLFVHYFDPHATYAPPSPFAERFAGRLYDGEIAYVDEQLGRLRRELEARGLLNDTVVVITADHGEGLGEHGEVAHGVFLYQSTMHVPLIVAAPGRWPAGRRVSGPVSLVDVAPTLLELTGLKVSGDMDGRSLAGFVEGGAAPERWLPLESEYGFNSYGWAPLVGLTNGVLKWVRAPRPELYDLNQDPGERHNRAAERRNDRRRIARLWKETVQEDRRASPVQDDSQQAEGERRARLAALGYVSAGAERPDRVGGDLPDPKDTIASQTSINEARALLSRRQFAEVERRLKAVLTQSPKNVSALVLLASGRIMAGSPARAVEPLRRAARLAPDNADVHFNLGLAWVGVGNAEGAEQAWRRTLRLAPRFQDAALNLIDLLRQIDRRVEAEAVLLQARGDGLDGPLFDFLEAQLALARGDRSTGRQALRRALAGKLPGPVEVEVRQLLERVGS